MRTFALALFATIAAAADDAITFGYTSDDQAAWSTLSTDYEACNNGISQSPINLDTTQAVATVADVLAYIPDADVTLLAESNMNFSLGDVSNPTVTLGTHEVKVSYQDTTDYPTNAVAADWITGDVEDWSLAQFHFHHPSEHTLDGVQQDFEMHMVHVAASGDLFVVGIFFDTTEDIASPFLDTFTWGTDSVSIDELNMMDFVDSVDFDDRFIYSGSLTTPPCTEIVSWNVVSTPMTMSVAQLDTYKAYFGSGWIGNARDTQPLNDRTVDLINAESLKSEAATYDITGDVMEEDSAYTLVASFATAFATIALWN